MPRCELTGIGPTVKNLVSHSNIKTKSKAMPNIQQKSLFSPTLKEMVSLKIATRTIRTLEKTGGFDSFILRQDDGLLSKRALKIKAKLKKRLNRRPKKKD